MKIRRKWRDTWRGSFGVQNEAGESITEFCQENTLVITNTLFQQHRRQLYTWTSPDGQYRNQNAYIICSWWWSSIQSAKTRLGADCGIEHEILIVKCRRKLKKVGKITRSCRYTAKSLQSCPTLCNPMDGSLPGSSVHGIFQARVLEWTAIAFSRGSSRPRDQTQVSLIVTDALSLEPPGKHCRECSSKWDTSDL